MASSFAQVKHLKHQQKQQNNHTIFFAATQVEGPTLRYGKFICPSQIALTPIKKQQSNLRLFLASTEVEDPTFSYGKCICPSQTALTRNKKQQSNHTIFCAATKVEGPAFRYGKFICHVKQLKRATKSDKSITESSLQLKLKVQLAGTANLLPRQSSLTPNKKQQSNLRLFLASTEVEGPTLRYGKFICPSQAFQTRNKNNKTITQSSSLQLKLKVQPSGTANSFAQVKQLKHATKSNKSILDSSSLQLKLKVQPSGTANLFATSNSSNAQQKASKQSHNLLRCN